MLAASANLYVKLMSQVTHHRASTIPTLLTRLISSTILTDLLPMFLCVRISISLIPWVLFSSTPQIPLGEKVRGEGSPTSHPIVFEEVKREDARNQLNAIKIIAMSLLPSYKTGIGHFS